MVRNDISMVRQQIYIHRYHWNVIVYYDTTYRDAYRILDELDDIGVDDATYSKAKRNLVAGMVDTGLTFSNPEERTSVMVLSRTSTKAEFANTWIHELLHCAEHIALACGLDPNGEPKAYVGGELARAMQPVAARFMCPTCNG